MRTAALLLLLPLAACGTGGETNVSIRADGEGGNLSIVADANGETRIRAGGMEGSFKLPKVAIDAENFDVNGVKLFPNSRITDLSVNGDAPIGQRADGRVVMSFDAPAPLGEVQAWFRERFAQSGFEIAAQGNGFAGTTSEGEPIKLELVRDGDKATRGTITTGR